jgi:hypothetical protein
VRRRDFTIGLLPATAFRTVCAREPAKQRRVAIVIPAGPVARINDPESRYWQAFWDEAVPIG